jgi:ParB-like chromosome segregation protein Spo0J
MKLKEIKANPDNPRILRDEKFAKLKQSISEFPKMMELRPIVVDENGFVLGGNMRLKALQELNYKEIPDNWVKRANELTPEEKQRFVIADNVGFGEWDWDELANNWDADDLSAWGLHIPQEMDFGGIDDDMPGAEGSKKKEEIDCPKCGFSFLK